MFTFDRPIPIFPLPNCVVLPGAVQGLHLFEPRYRAMIRDEMTQPAGQRMIAMALLRPGYEPLYCSHQAPIHPTLCLGEMIKCEELQDGRFNILLLGQARVSVIEEIFDRSYRRAKLKIESTIADHPPAVETELRRKLAEAIMTLPTEEQQLATDFTVKEDQCLERLTDLLTYYVLSRESIPAKQMILAEPRLDFRVKMLITLLHRKPAGGEGTCSTTTWPPDLNLN